MDWRHGLFRAFRDRYVAPLGGLSYDLAPGALGVHPQDLARVPELAGRDVLVSAPALPPGVLHRRPSFRIVELTAAMRDALPRAHDGVVFSVFEMDDPAVAPLLGRLRPGEPLYLNSALGRLGG